MDVTVITSDPDVVDTAEIRNALENLGYLVATVTIVHRE